MLSQYGDHLYKIVVKFDFKSQSYGPETILLKGHTVNLTFKVAPHMLCATQSYGPDTILLQGHAVTLTFKVGTQMLHATRRLNMVVISVK